MRRYIFLLIAFFLTFSAHAQGLGISTSMMGVTSKTAVKETSNRNVNELGNIQESTKRSQQETSNGVPNLNSKKGKTALSNVSCKTYEGKIYYQGEAGYNDCIRTIKIDRQSDKIVP